MEIKELKQLLKNSGSVVMVEDGEPSFVVLSYETYKGLASNSKSSVKKESMPAFKHIAAVTPPSVLTEAQMLEKLNREILSLKNQIENEEKSIQQNMIAFSEDEEHEMV